MYHYYFNLAKNDRNGACIYMPHRKSANLPTVIECFGSHSKGKSFSRRAAESLRDAVYENEMVFVSMDFPTDSTNERIIQGIGDMLTWLKRKDVVHNEKIGYIAFGTGITPVLQAAAMDHQTAFVVTTGRFDFTGEYPDPTNIPDGIVCPILSLRGTHEDIFRRVSAVEGKKILRDDDPAHKFTKMTFEHGDHYLCCVKKQAADAAAKWINEQVRS